MPTMMMSRRRRCTTSLVLLVALATCCSSFQVAIPSSVRLAPAIHSKPAVVRFMATETDDADTKTTSAEISDIEVPKFDSKDFEETESGPGLDWFSVVLVGYVIFAIADTAFHITTDKPYIQALMEAIFGSGSEQDMAAST